MNNSYFIFAERKRGKYSILGNFCFFIRQMGEYSRWYPYGMAASSICNIGYNFMESVLPALVVYGLEHERNFSGFFAPLLAIGCAMVIFHILLAFLKNYLDEQKRFLPWFLSDKYFRKMMQIDYDAAERREKKEIISNVWNSANNARGFYEGADQIPVGLESLIGVGIYGFLLGRFHIGLLLLIFGSVAVNLYLLGIARKMHKKYFGRIAAHSQGIQYLSGVTMDSSAGKDIRIYRMLDFLLKKYDESLSGIGGLYSKIHNWYCFRNLSSAFLEFLKDGAAYFLLIHWVLDGRISAAMFVFLLDAAANLSGYFESLLRVAMIWNTMDTSVGYYRQFLELKSRWKQDSGVAYSRLDAIKKGGITLELSHVTYTYEGDKEPVIKDLSLKIRSGEKLALIGLNGAGKTTLVKLICGMYEPDSGEIRLGGILRSEYTKDQYISLISVMFQDSGFLPLSVDENLTCDDTAKIDNERLNKALSLSGFHEKYDKLSEGGKTLLIKKLSDRAADFSGGEKQKFLFARAIYKDAPLVILDEPTAALDPVAEQELYQNFKEAVGERSVVYISHRLSSTRFCDRIVLLEDGRICEEGTHEELMRAKGRYEKLYELQSKYYRDEQEKERKRKFFQ